MVYIELNNEFTINKLSLLRDELLSQTSVVLISGYDEVFLRQIMFSEVELRLILYILYL